MSDLRDEILKSGDPDSSEILLAFDFGDPAVESAEAVLDFDKLTEPAKGAGILIYLGRDKAIEIAREILELLGESRS